VSAELFVMVRGSARVWRLTRYDNRWLYLSLPDKPAHMQAVKDVCRVGEAKHWRESISFAAAWHAGGGELFFERPGDEHIK
jgi:hypothetical protein